jgi:curli biogenesis system outer membrane secretion channel CsgG/ribosomal protein S27AE
MYRARLASLFQSREVPVKSVQVRAAVLAVGGLVCALACGCAGTKDTASADKLTQNVGRYSPPPSINDEDKPKVGVPSFQMNAVPGQFSGNKTQLAQNAADQMTTLLVETGRFNVVERAQIEQLLKEQDMEGIVRPDQAAKAGQVLGTDYLLLGKVTNFRVKQSQTKSGVDVGGIGGMVGGGRFGAGSTGFDKKNQQITTEIGVDIRLVDSTTGAITIAKASEFNRTDSADAMGVSVFGMGGHSDAQITIEEDDAGRLLRLAFDKAVREMLPEIDRKILSKSGRAKKNAASANVNEVRSRPTRSAAVAAEPADDTNASPSDPDAGDDNAAPEPAAKAPAKSGAAAKTNAAAAKKFCPECGEALAAGAKFCPKCGAAVK